MLCILHRIFWKKSGTNSRKPNFVWHIFDPSEKPAARGYFADIESSLKNLNRKLPI